MEVSKYVHYKEQIVDNVGRVIVGKDNITQLVIVAFICGAHVLLEDVPGTGKTMLLRAFSKSIGGDFKRIQFTPDLLPSDLTGVNFYNQKLMDFEFRAGPLFSNIVLADEINRATPRTQSSLLEAMEERQITIDGTTHSLAAPFMVMATQNPIESYGTFPLPEAQIDRFFMRLKMGYPTRSEEMSILSRKNATDIVDSLDVVVSPEDTEYVTKHLREITVSAPVSGYIMDIIEKTRVDSHFSAGISTRGAIALFRAAQAYAAINGREFVLPEDVKYIAPFVLNHRISVGGTISSGDVDSYMSELVDSLRVPTETL